MKLHYATNLRLRAWIRVSLRPIRLPLTRMTLRREFSDHFEDCRDAMLDKGLSEREADEEALELLGSAREVGKLLKLVYRPKIYLIRAAILLLALLYLLPWPTRINRQFYGRLYWMDGTPPESVSFTLQGWKLDYLFKRDRLNLELIWDRPEDGEKLFPPPLMNPQEVLGYETPGRYYHDEPLFWGTDVGPVYPSKELFHPTYMIPKSYLRLSPDGTSCMLHENIAADWYILASNNPNTKDDALRTQYAEPLQNFINAREAWINHLNED